MNIDNSEFGAGSEFQISKAAASFRKNTKNVLKRIEHRLTRTESRVVSGFKVLGANVDEVLGDYEIDHETNIQATNIEFAILKLLRRIEGRLTRIESRTVRGFEAMGAWVTKNNSDWIVVNQKDMTIRVDTITHSIADILDEAAEQGASIGKGEYRLMCGSRLLAWL